MTSLVGILCRDGVVIGSDGSATFADGGGRRTIEQPIGNKIEIIEEHMIIAGTGYVGHMQRFVSVVGESFRTKAFSGKSDLEVAKLLSAGGLKDFGTTFAVHPQRPPDLEFSALVAYSANGRPQLCELPGGMGHFQPELKKIDGLWFSSMGSGQSITDPFLALFKSIFWSDGPPSIQGGVFTALWALSHACDVNPGGIARPIRIAVLSAQKGSQFKAKFLDESELQEHESAVTSATEHMRKFRDVLEGKSAVPIPVPGS